MVTKEVRSGARWGVRRYGQRRDGNLGGEVRVEMGSKKSRSRAR